MVARSEKFYPDNLNIYRSREENHWAKSNDKMQFKE